MTTRRSPAAESQELARYPLRQSLTASPEKLASLRGSGLFDWLSKPERYLLKDDGERITVCAANESALEEATAVFAQAHGPWVAFGPPQVHSLPAAQTGVRLRPVMSVRVQIRREHAERILQELVRRRATIVEEDPQCDGVVLRAEARLADLLGFPAFVHHTTNGGAGLWVWLLRYSADA